MVRKGSEEALGEEKQIKNERSTPLVQARKKIVLNNEKKCEIYLSGFESSINFGLVQFFPHFIDTSAMNFVKNM